MKQGSIWKIDLDPTIGAEMQKSRPCLILSSDKIGKLPLKIIAPITEYKEPYRFVPWMVAIEPSKKNGLSKVSVIDLFQVRSVSQERLIGKIGEIDKRLLNQCKKAIDIVFEMKEL